MITILLRLKKYNFIHMFWVRRVRLLVFFTVFSLSSCSAIKYFDASQPVESVGLETVHTLDVYVANDTIYSLFSGIDQQTKQPTLKFIASVDTGKTWSTPVMVNRDMAVIKKSKRGNDFQIAASEQAIMVVWKTKGDEPWVGVMTAALSTDKGKTWEKIASPVGDKFANIEQGYFDLSSDDQGGFHLVWLDDREEAGDTQGLRFASYQNGHWQNHADLEATACTCCWTKITADKKGNIHVLYRDDNPRDMKLISSFDNGVSWQKSRPVWSFGWDFVGCPHQGGGLATAQENEKIILHSVIWNGEEARRGLYYRRSGIAEEMIDGKIDSLGDNSSASADIAVSNKAIGVVYTSGFAEKKRVMAKISLDGGVSWLQEQRLTQEAAEPSHPRIISTSEGFRFFWTEWQENGDAMAMTSAFNL